MILDNALKEMYLGKYDERIIDIYEDKELLDVQKHRYLKLLSEFKDLFGDCDINIFSSPGRTEICGNHTDHQNGRVLAGAINLDILSVVSKRDDGVISIITDGKNLNKIDINSLEKSELQAANSESIVRGVVYRLKSLGYKIGGFNACITSDVLIGSGLSSSAAFENLIGIITSYLYNGGKIESVELAKAGQYAEREYYGKPCGLMDQMASSIGGLVYIDFDGDLPSYNQIKLDLSKHNSCLCIVDTKASHEGLTNEYAAIPNEMSKIANHYNKSKLRDVNEEVFYKDIINLREKYGDRAVLRAMHFFEENKRVCECVEKLQENDFEKFKSIVKNSGDSSFKYLQNVFSQHNIDEQSMSIALFITEKVLGHRGVCRVHGGGFAGTIQAFVDEDYVQTYKQNIESIFGKEACLVLKIRKYGAMVVI
jgi:galactokinase